jgi:hypothetical protein
MLLRLSVEQYEQRRTEVTTALVWSTMNAAAGAAHVRTCLKTLPERVRVCIHVARAG